MEVVRCVLIEVMDSPPSKGFGGGHLAETANPLCDLL
jgi:hypothetical protein